MYQGSLQCGPNQIRNRQHDYEKDAESYVQELLGLLEQVKVECILGIGHPDGQKSPISVDTLQHKKIRKNCWA